MMHGAEINRRTCCTCGSLAKEVRATAWLCRLSCWAVSSPSSISTRPAQGKQTGNHILITQSVVNKVSRWANKLVISKQRHENKEKSMIEQANKLALCAWLAPQGDWSIKATAISVTTWVLRDDEGHSVGPRLHPDEATLPVHWLLRLCVGGTEPVNSERSHEICVVFTIFSLQSLQSAFRWTIWSGNYVPLPFLVSCTVALMTEWVTKTTCANKIRIVLRSHCFKPKMPKWDPRSVRTDPILLLCCDIDAGSTYRGSKFHFKVEQAGE